MSDEEASSKDDQKAGEIAADSAQADGEMPYLLSGARMPGVRIFHIVRGLSAADAIARLENEGYRDVWAHTDDARWSGLQAVRREADVIEVMGPEAAARMFEGRGFSHHLYSCFQSMLMTWQIMVPGILALIALRWWGMSTVWWCAAVIVLGLYPFAHRWWTTANSRLLRSIERARAEADSVLVLRLASVPFRSPGCYTRTMLSTSFRAMVEALAASGRVAEAVSGAETFEKEMGAGKDWLWGTLSMVHDRCGDHERALRCCEEEAKLPGSGYAPLLRSAEILALRLRRPEEARAAIDKVLSNPIAVRSLAYVKCVEGWVLVREGRFQEAQDILELVIPELERKRGRQPTVVITIAVARLHLAVALAGCGETKRARKVVAKADERLLIHKEDKLLEWARQEIAAAENASSDERGPTR
ncbi:MAG: tetratricopeptide repeat protein [Planctomycetota bacterium]